MSSSSQIPENIPKSSSGCKVAPLRSGHFEASKNQDTEAKLMTRRADLPNSMETQAAVQLSQHFPGYYWTPLNSPFLTNVTIVWDVSCSRAACDSTINTVLQPLETLSISDLLELLSHLVVSDKDTVNYNNNYCCSQMSPLIDYHQSSSFPLVWFFIPQRKFVWFESSPKLCNGNSGGFFGGFFWFVFWGFFLCSDCWLFL